MNELALALAASVPWIAMVAIFWILVWGLKNDD